MQVIRTLTVFSNKKLRMTCALIALTGAWLAFSGAGQADTPAGVWLTQPDAKGQVAYVVSKPCGKGYCGTIARAFDAKGREVTTPNIGKRVFWDMVPEGSDYAGRAYVPAHNREYAGRLQVRGNSMKVKGCLGPVCQGQTWKRVN